MYGIVGGLDGKRGLGRTVDFEQCFQTIQKYIIQPNQSDIFIHSWSVEHQNKLIELYKPVQHIIEPQKYFDYSIRKIKNTVDDNSKNANEIHGRLANTSHWYSVMKSIELKRCEEELKQFTYDYVMICRFDLMFFTILDFSSLKKGCFYASNYNYETSKKINNGKDRSRCEDLWFMGSSKLMDDFATIYQHHQQYKWTPHRAIWQHLESFCDPHKMIQYIFWRGEDYEIYRHWIKK